MHSSPKDPSEPQVQHAWQPVRWPGRHGMQAAADQNSSNTHRNQCMCAACTHRCMMTELHTRGAVCNFVQGPQYNVQWHIVHNAHNPQAIQEGVKSRKPSGRYCNNFEETSKQCEHNERSTACPMKRAYLCSPGIATLKATFAALTPQWATNALFEAQALHPQPCCHCELSCARCATSGFK